MSDNEWCHHDVILSVQRLNIWSGDEVVMLSGILSLYNKACTKSICEPAGLSMGSARLGWRKLVLVEINGALYCNAYQYYSNLLVHFNVYFCTFLVRIDETTLKACEGSIEGFALATDCGKSQCSFSLTKMHWLVVRWRSTFESSSWSCNTCVGLQFALARLARRLIILSFKSRP